MDVAVDQQIVIEKPRKDNKHRKHLPGGKFHVNVVGLPLSGSTNKAGSGVGAPIECSE